MSTAASGARNLISQLTPLGKRLLSKGSKMAAAVAPLGIDDGKPRYRRLTVRAEALSPIGADPRIFSLVNPFRAADSPVQVVVVGSKQSAEYWSQRVLEAAAHDKVVGIDLEWKPRFKKAKSPPEVQKAAVIQVSVKGMTLLVQLTKLGYVPGPLLELLGDSSFVKVGVSIEDDLNLLMRGYKVECSGYHDVGMAAARIVEKGATLNQYGLKRMVEALCGFTLEKSKSVRMSNWEAVFLSEQQVAYAAMDALAGREAYLELISRGEMEAAYLEGLMRAWLASEEKREQSRAKLLSKETAQLRQLYFKLAPQNNGGEQHKRPAANGWQQQEEGARPAKRPRMEPRWEMLGEEVPDQDRQKPAKKPAGDQAARAAK